LAQDTQNSQNQAAPAATTSQTTNATSNNSQAATNQSDSTTSSRQPLVYESRQGFWGKINPFARKKYVQKQLQPVRDRLNELDELTASNSKAIKDVDSRAQEGIRNADAHANQADQHAVDAGNRAQAAQQLAQQTQTRLTTVEGVVGKLDQYQPATQVEIRFRPGQPILSAKAKSALDDLAANLKNSRGYIIEVQGFSSGRGAAAIQNSERMAQAVVRYLVLNHEVPIYRVYEVGMGNAPVQATTTNARPRRTTGGRVEVSLLKNGIEGLETAQNAGQAPAQGTATMPQGEPQSQYQQNAAPQQQQQQAAPATQQQQNTVPPKR
jgi:outer membrane protein OmpA-like peptidoglycan-associated protein